MTWVYYCTLVLLLDMWYDRMCLNRSRLYKHNNMIMVAWTFINGGAVFSPHTLNEIKYSALAATLYSFISPTAQHYSSDRISNSGSPHPGCQIPLTNAMTSSYQSQHKINFNFVMWLISKKQNIHQEKHFSATNWNWLDHNKWPLFTRMDLDLNATSQGIAQFHYCLH